MPGPVEDVLGAALFDDPARVHHGDPVAQLRDDAEIVRDEDDRQAARAPQIVEDCQHLRLNRNVERRGRLIGDDDVGIVCESHGDPNPLAHPT